MELGYRSKAPQKKNLFWISNRCIWKVWAPEMRMSLILKSIFFKLNMLFLVALEWGYRSMILLGENAILEIKLWHLEGFGHQNAHVINTKTRIF